MTLLSLRNSRLSSLFAGVLAVAFLGFSIPTAHASQAQTLGDQVKNAEDQAGTVKDVLETGADFAEELGDLLDDSRLGDVAERAGKYAKILDGILKIIKAGRLSAEAITALRNGDRDAFIKVFNELGRDAATALGGAGGTAAGGMAGTAICPGLGTLIGGVLGGLLGDKAIGWIYDNYLQDIIKDIGGDLFDRLTGTTPGTGLPTPDDGGGGKDDEVIELESFGT